MTNANDPDTLDSKDASLAITDDVTCLACGCLCDDLAVVVEEGRIVEAMGACPTGRDWFLSDHSQAGTPLATIGGRAAGRDEAVGRAAQLLARARAPVILGLLRSSSEAAAAALALADRVGAAVEVGDAVEAAARLAAYQRVGRVSATLGEVRDRADLVVFWGADPVSTHPRHLERYSVEPAGRFAPRGRPDRTLIVIDEAKTPTAERADLFIPIPTARWVEAIGCLRSVLRDAVVDPGRVRDSVGLERGILEDLALRLRSARYGAFFVGDFVGRGGGEAGLDALYRLVRDLNRGTRFIVLPLGAPGNLAGAEAVLSWQSGFANQLDYGGGAPASLAGETSASARLGRSEADLVLELGIGAADALGAQAAAQLDGVPRIVIAPGATEQERPATVALASATPGIDSGGTVMRCDGVVLRLRAPLAPSVPSDRDWLLAIGERLAALGH